MVVTELGMVTDSSDQHDAKAHMPMRTTESGMVTVLSDEQK